MEMLHATGLSHRDISLHDLLVPEDLSTVVTKLVGYGVPTLRHTAARARGVPGFSHEYASPELLRGELGVQDVDAWQASDVFSFAVRLVEVMTLQRPWDGELAVYITRAVVGHESRRWAHLGDLQYNGARSMVLEALVRRAWHQAAKQRPNSIEEIRQLLRWIQVRQMSLFMGS